MLVAALKEYDELKHNEPVLNRRVPKIRFSKKFFSENKEDENLLIIDKGRNIEERSVVLIEGGTYKGYAFFDLNYQVNNLEVLKNILTPVKEDKQNRSEEHTSELQSRQHLVCRLLLEKKKQNK